MSAMRTTRIPGLFLCHPAPIVAAAVILVNDLVVKPHWPGVVSGKLSGLGICFLLPLVVAAAWEWGAWLLERLRLPRPVVPPHLLALLSCLLAASYYAALELSPAWIEVHRTLIAALGGARHAAVTRDLTDLGCLPLVPLAGVFLLRRTTVSSRSGSL